MIKVIYNKVCGRCVQSEPLTSGMVGQPIELGYSPDFDGLTLTAVFTNGKTTVDVLNPGNQCVIPHEVLDTVGTLVKVGIYATKGNELVIPTVYAAIGVVLKGADPSGDTETDPTLPIWAQIQALIGDLADLETEAKNNLVSAINEAAQTGSGGANIALRVEGGYIQYTVDGKTWANLIAVADLKGQAGADGKDGITPTIGDNGNWYLGNTDTGKPSRGDKGAAGRDGVDGHSPVVTAEKTDKTTTISVDGKPIATISDGKDGVSGADGKDGVDGHTPVKGVDYWTAADKSEIVEDTAAAIDLTAYAKTTDVPTKTSQLENDSGFVAASELAAGLANKQDIISDLATIRSGAAKGTTALQSVPSSYRTAAAQDVIDSGKQDKITSTNKLAYSLISGTPTIPTVPTNVSAFTNDAGYLTLATLPKYEGVVE